MQRIPFDQVATKALGGRLRHSRHRPLTAGLLLATALGGCGTNPAGDGLLDKTLGVIGLQKMERPSPAPLTPELLQAIAPTKIPLRIHASNQLNSDGATRPLSLVIKIYKLKDHEEFLHATYKSFSQGAYTHDDVISSREVVLLPGQRYEVEESLPRGTTHLAVAALFRSPDELRWRFVFDVKTNAKQGVTVGAHQCALSVAQGVPVGSPPEAQRLAGTVCR